VGSIRITGSTVVPQSPDSLSEALRMTINSRKGKLKNCAKSSKIEPPTQLRFVALSKTVEHCEIRVQNKTSKLFKNHSKIETNKPGLD
jgi:hypothetical protein